MCSNSWGDRRARIWGPDLGPDPQSSGLQAGNRRVDVQRVPPCDGIQPEAERAELVFHPALVPVHEAAEVAEEHAAGQVVAGLADVAAPIIRLYSSTRMT